MCDLALSVIKLPEFFWLVFPHVSAFSFLVMGPSRAFPCQFLCYSLSILSLSSGFLVVANPCCGTEWMSRPQIWVITRK